jgi:hypothetical protein
MPRVQDTYLELKHSVDAKVWDDMLKGLSTLSTETSIDLSHETKNLSQPRL